MKDKSHRREFQCEPALERIEHIMELKEKHKAGLKPATYEDYRHFYPKYVWFDKKCGKIIWFSRVGEYATHGRYENLQPDEWVECMSYEMEGVEQRLREISNDQKKDAKGYVSVADMKGLGLKAIAQRKAIINLGNNAGEMYPEVIDKVYLINAPWFVSKVFNVFKPLL